MVKVWGRLARTQRAVTAAATAIAPLPPRVQQLLRAAGQELPRPSVGENAREGMGIRPQGGSNRGPTRAGEDMDRCKGLLGLPLASNFRAADHTDRCQRRLE